MYWRKPVEEGGYDNKTGGFKIMPDGSKEEISFNVNDVVIFKDTYPAGNPNHQYDYTAGWDSQSDTVYEVRGVGREGGFSDCEIVEKECCQYSGSISCDVSCPSDKWLISGGGECSGHLSTSANGIQKSYPKTAGKGGTWHIYGPGLYWESSPDGNACVKAYALCC